MKRLLAIILATALLTTLVAACTAPSATQAPVTQAPPVVQKVIEWKAITGPDRTDGHTANYTLPLFDEINKQLAGRLRITYAGGPESVPPFAQMAPLRQGVFDLLGTTPSFYGGDLPIAQVGFLLSAPTSDLRAVGMIDLIDEIHQKKLNVKLLSGFASGVGNTIFLKTKLGKADLTGLKIRTSAIYDPGLKGLGAATVTLPIGDVYGALDKGIVDGAAFPAIGPLAFKWHEVAKWMTRPLFAAAPMNIIVNMDSWNKLPKDLQDGLIKVVVQVENAQRPKLQQAMQAEEAELVKNGVQIDTLTGAEAAKLLTIVDERSWQELVIKADPDYGPKLKALADKLPKR